MMMQLFLNLDFDWLTTEGCPLKILSIVGGGELLGRATVTS